MPVEYGYVIPVEHGYVMTVEYGYVIRVEYGYALPEIEQRYLHYTFIPARLFCKLKGP